MASWADALRADDDETWPTQVMVGTASTGGTAQDAPADNYPLATLWLPNVEYKHGWEMIVIRRKPEQPQPKRLGFRGT